jgi:hypothetical protein
MIRVVGDILTAFSIELDISEEAFNALDEGEQRNMIARELGGGGWGAKRDLRIDFVEETEP